MYSFLYFSFLTANAQTYTKLFDFDGINGEGSSASLVLDGTYLYGMTMGGGDNLKGVIFKIKVDGTGYTKLLDFNGTNGEYPFGTLTSDGTYLYGMTQLGGDHHYGVIFKIKMDGKNYTKLLDFDGVNGRLPQGSLVLEDGNLYGMTSNGGANNDDYGVIFKIKTDGTGYTKLFDFDGINGENPSGSLVSDGGTYLYGMTPRGGSYNDGYDYGVIFKLKKDGSGYTKLFDFNGTNGKRPYGSLILDCANLFGMTDCTNGDGLIFKIKTDGLDYSKLFDFKDVNGASPNGSLVSDGGTYLYGMTYFGGSYGKGVIFKLNDMSINSRK